MKILITGYTGFIGLNLTRSLKSYSLVGVDLYKNSSISTHYNWETFNNATDIDCIIHLAGKAHDVKNTSEEKEYFDVNVGLTQKIFQHFLNSKATKFVFFSSVKAVADSVIGHQLTEDETPNPQTPYGRSKLLAENYILKQSLPDNKKVYILRPCMIHGPGNKGNLNLLYKMVTKGLPWPLGAFENQRSFTSIGNIIYIINQLIEKDIESGIYQVADDEPLSTSELIRLIATAQSRKPRIYNLPSLLINFLAKIGNYLHLPLNSERLNKLTESYVVSNQKIKKALNIEKMPISSVEGLNKTIKSFQNKNH